MASRRLTSASAMARRPTVTCCAQAGEGAAVTMTRQTQANTSGTALFIVELPSLLRRARSVSRSAGYSLLSLVQRNSDARGAPSSALRTEYSHPNNCCGVVVTLMCAEPTGEMGPGAYGRPC